MDQWKIPFENLEDVALVVLYFDFIFAKDNPLFWTKKDETSFADFWKRRNLVFSVFKWLPSILILSQDYFSKFKKSFFKTDPMVKTPGMKNS
jgi:hypothetical protein